MKKIILIYILVFCSVFYGKEALDTPIVLSANSDAAAILFRIGDSLPKDEDRFYFEQAHTAIRNYVFVDKACSELTPQSREAMYRQLIDGMTPRSLILWGMSLRLYQYRQYPKADGNRKREDEGGLSADDERATKLTLDAIKRYSINQESAPLVQPK